MKLTAVFLLLFLPFFAFAQFSLIPSGTNAELWDVHFSDSLNGIIVGDSATILLTTNGGLTWNDIPNAFGNASLRRVRYIDANNLLIVGGNWTASLYHSTDGGWTWTAIMDSTQQNYTDIQVLNDSTALVSGFPKNLIKTTDRGLSWQTIYTGDSSSTIELLSFVDQNTGFAAGWGGGYFDRFRKTTDGGQTWSTVILNSGSDNVVLEAFHFFNASEGIYGGWYLANLRRTSNGGLDWTDVVPQDSMDNIQVMDIHFPDSLNGFVSTWYGDVLKSNDQGFSWTYLNMPAGLNAKLNGVWFHDKDLGWVVGSNGTILRTGNGGGPLAIDDLKGTEGISIWPVPARNQVKLAYPAGLHIIKMRIVDINGRQILEIDGKADEICVQGWKTGMYFLQIETGSGIIVKRMQVE